MFYAVISKHTGRIMYYGGYSRYGWILCQCFMATDMEFRAQHYVVASRQVETEEYIPVSKGEAA